MKKSKGFTLAELLIVVAIISVLTGVSIPVFTAQLEKSREATDLANARSIYAEVLHAAISYDTNPDPSTGVVYENGSWRKTISLKQKEAGWQTKLPVNIGDMTSGEDGSGNENWVGSPTRGGQCVVYYYDEIGTVITWDMNFAKVLNELVIDDSHTDVASTYRNKSIAVLLKSYPSYFPMLDSTGGAGQKFADAIKETVGLGKTAYFAYTATLDPDNENGYCIYISTQRNLTGNGTVTSGKDSGSTIKTIGYKFDIEKNELVAVGPEVDLKTYGGKNGQEKMKIVDYQFY